MMTSLAPALKKEIKRRGAVVEVDARVSTGLARPDVFDWTKSLETKFNEQFFDYAIVVLGTNDGQDFVRGDRLIPYGTREWVHRLGNSSRGWVNDIAATEDTLVISLSVNDIQDVDPGPGVDRTTDGGPFGGDGGLDSLRVSHRGEILHGEHRGRRGRAEEVRAVDDIDVAGQLSSARPRGPTPGVRGHRGGERGAPRRPWKRRHRAASREEPARDLDVVSSGERIGEVAGVLMDAGRWTDERGDVETDAQGVVHRVVYRIAYMPSKTSVSPTTCSPSRCDDRWVWTVAHLSSRPR